MQFCQICNEKKATANHIKTHGMTYQEYLMEYDPERYLKNGVIEKINDLYVANRYEFYFLNDQGKYYKSKRTGPLNDGDIKDHLDRKKTLAVVPGREKTKFISFDIDTRDVEVLENVASAIETYVNSDAMLITFSGNKGFHIDIFFEQMIFKYHARKFYELILRDTGYSQTVVECRGEGRQAVKLPLGSNFKNPDRSTNYCYPVTKYGRELAPGFMGWASLVNVKKTPVSVIYDAIEVNAVDDIFTDQETNEIDELKSRHEADHTTPAENKREYAEHLLENGISEKGSRNRASWIIATYLKDQGFTQEKTAATLLKWHKEKLNPNMSKITPEEAQQAVKDTVATVYRRDYKILTSKKKVTIERTEFKEILSVKKAHLRFLYFIMYLHSKAHRNENTGVFYMTYEQMENAGAIKNDRGTLKRYIEELARLGKVEVVRSNYRVEGHLKHEPNQYRIHALSHPAEFEVEDFRPCELLNKKCIDCAACHLLNDDEIKENFDRRKAGPIKKALKYCDKPN